MLLNTLFLALRSIRRNLLRSFLTILGIVIGIIIATGASIALAAVMEVPYLFDPAINAFSFVFSAAIGVVFGYFPARRAAQMDPIEALRHE